MVRNACDIQLKTSAFILHKGMVFTSFMLHLFISTGCSDENPCTRSDRFFRFLSTVYRHGMMPVLAIESVSYFNGKIDEVGLKSWFCVVRA